MKINLDKHYTIVLSKWGSPDLIKHKENPDFDKHGRPVGSTLYFQTFGQAVKSYILQSASDADINSFEEMANFIDGKLKGAELKINQVINGCPFCKRPLNEEEG